MTPFYNPGARVRTISSSVHCEECKNLPNWTKLTVRERLPLVDGQHHYTFEEIAETLPHSCIESRLPGYTPEGVSDGTDEDEDPEMHFGMR
ncbi:hypothetical protein SAMN05216548_11443 [Faunimonas pinastri]|uniref:Uncharacterized protein n=1 Tax=Faunimonas pinastri TaxID=1855383 RepID=A0A1H9MTG5_9HYPH|nr:hypothetical protein SAMN05216548_11443 [Faunimonas pinastri]